MTLFTSGPLLSNFWCGSCPDDGDSFVETEETNIVVDMGSIEIATVKMPSVKVSITAGNSLGGIAVSAEPRTFAQVSGATG